MSSCACTRTIDLNTAGQSGQENVARMVPNSARSRTNRRICERSSAAIAIVVGYFVVETLK